MRRATTLLATIALTVATLSLPAAAHEIPDHFGTDWDDPRTARQPIDRPGTESCEITLVDHAFDGTERVESEFKPPRDCGGDWSAIVLRLDGSGEGRQAERLGRLTIGGVPVFATSTPRPSPEGIEWSREKDLSGYAALLSTPHDAAMTFDGGGDGVLDVTVTLTFYATNDRHPPIEAAESVLPLRAADTDGPGLTGSLRTPRNTERLLADVYATATGGCEKTWYLVAPSGSGYRCENDDGPYRELRVYLDGELAGLAAPYPHVCASGWANPYLWYTLPAPRSFDLRPLTVDLTPYLGRLNDGDAHEVRIEVAGAGSGGWSTPVGFRAWQDEDRRVVRGGLLDSHTGEAVNDVEHDDGETDTVDVEAGHGHSATGWLATSHGNLMTTVKRTVSMTATHTWGPGTDTDALTARFTDVASRSTLTGDGTISERVVEREFGVDGRIRLGAGDRLTTDVELSDTKRVTGVDLTGDRTSYRVSDTYSGGASYLPDVPRGDRAATGVSQRRYRVSGDADCFDRTIATRNGQVTGRIDRCRTPSG